MTLIQKMYYAYRQAGEGAISMATVKGQIGDINPNHQRFVAKTNLLGTDHNQRIWQVLCDKCGTEYGANGSDFHHRKCPVCQGGAAGLELV
jgi:hypothetical protein